MIGVERTDFVSIPTRDRDRAVQFYGETLGLPGETFDSSVCHMELRAGQG